MAGSTAPSVSSAPAGGGGGAVVDADYKAAYLRNPKPPYPPAALKMRVEGTVTLRVLVLEDGTSGKIVLSKSSGNESLDQSALETVAKWKFTPAKSQGQSIAQWVSIPINFSIKRR
jgi:protein TonB